MSIEIKNISKSYGSKKVLDSVTFNVDRGELLGFLGPNGAGKSTLMKIIAGFSEADQGEIFINNRKVFSNDTIYKKDIGYLPENNPLYPDLYVKESLELAAGIFKINNKKQRINEIVKLTGLTSESHKKIGTLSKGYRQRVGIAQALIHNPSVLILDEPTTGLDPNQLEEIRNLIREISTEKTVIFSTHIMQEVEAICKRAVIINKGSVIADGNVEELKIQSKSNSRVLIVEFDKKVKEQKILQIKGIVNVSWQNGKWLIESAPDKDIRPEIFRFAVENNLVLLTMNQNVQSIESVFQKLTK